MNREIEFRGRTAKGEWVYGYYYKAKALLWETEQQEDWILQNDCYNIVSKHPVIPETVGQYTGIKDKNGKKIFEGDIVKRRYFNHEVVFGEYGKEPHTTIGFFTKENEALFIGEEDDFYYGGINSIHEIEVLGNVFDNPELLNKIEYKGESDNGD
jgi:uncharacterized phage protein (TIGR01671 family)